jgi:hypothetical protein
MMNAMLPLALAVSSFGLAFWMPRQSLGIRATFTLVFASVTVVGLIALMQPNVGESSWLPWFWAAIGLANVLGWIQYVVRSPDSHDVDSQDEALR